MIATDRVQLRWFGLSDTPVPRFDFIGAFNSIGALAHASRETEVDNPHLAVTT